MGGGGGGRSMNAITNAMQTPDQRNATSELAAFREQQARSDYRTAGETGKATENSLLIRANRANPLKAIMSPPDPTAGGIQVPA
jgi:hypothetical protein